MFFYGIIWGLLELTLGGFLHATHFPYKGLIMGSIGFTILAAYLVRHRKALHVALIGIIAASFKSLNIFIFGVPLFSPNIINPALAIVAEGLIMSGAAIIINFLFTHKHTPTAR